MICPRCGAANDGPGRFCSACNAPLHVTPPGTAAPAAREEGRSILGGRFKVVRSLGKGGMGEILLAEDVRLGRKVAIKSIGADTLRDCDAKARFLREAQAASQLDHPNICTIYEIAEEEGREFIVMQYVDGVTLDQLMKMKPLSLDKVAAIASQIAEGMAAAQSRNIVHRDIKPGNIMIDRSGQVKILDFGLAKICSGSGPGAAEDERLDSDLTQKGIVLGTVAYMSPEQARGSRLDSRSDIFSYGVVLYEMIENRNPFTAEDNIVTLFNVLHHEIEFSRHAPEALRAIVRKALQKDRGQRYGDFNEIRKDLAAFRSSWGEKRPVAGETEVIDAREQSQMLRESDSRRPASDGEPLGEMVLRLKRMKASTEALRTSKARRLKLAAALLLPLSAVILWLLFFRGGTPAGARVPAEARVFRILLHTFENQTPDARIGAAIQYLLQEALSQFEGFQVLDAATLRDLNGGREITPDRLPRLLATHDIRFELRGRLSSVADKFNIEARLGRAGEPERHAPFFIPGKERNSLLTDQVDNLARRVRQAVLEGQPDSGVEPVRIATMYGSDWRAFAMFHRGLGHWERKQFGEARRFLLQANSLSGGMPAARHCLALLEDYTGNAAEALGYLKALLPDLAKFSRPLQLRIGALKAKFDFDLRKQIGCLQELKENSPFRKEMILELGEAYFRRGNADRAIPEYEAALALDPNYAAALNHLGYCLSYLGRHQQAIECFERYRDIDRTANSFDSLGDGYFYLGDYIQSENSKIFAVSLDGSMDWPYLTIADIHVLRANLQEAEKSLATYQKLAQYPKAQADVQTRRAFLSYLQGDFSRALQGLDLALRRHDSTSINEHSAESHWLKGLCHLAGGDRAAAERELGWLRSLCDAYRLSADNFDAALKYRLHLEARIAEAQGRQPHAREVFQVLLKMKTQLSFWITYFNYQFFMTEYAEFLLRQGDAAAARRALEQCLAFNPGYPPALWAESALLKSTGDPRRREVLRRIAAVYGPGGERNRWRDKLAAELGKQ